MKRLYSFLLFVYLSLQLPAQQFHALKIGDKVPDVVLTLYNYKQPTAHLSDFKNTSFILDFWATTCSPCVGAFPKLDSLQKRFRDRLTILPVTIESKTTVATFFKRFYNVTHITSLSVVNDTIMNRLFPYRTVPQYVFIDKNGIVKAITFRESLTNENITAFLEGKSLALPVKQDDIVVPVAPSSGNLSDLLTSKGAFKLGDEIREDSSLLSVHLWAPCIPSYAGGYSDRANLLAMSNASIRALFAVAYGESIFKFTRGFDNRVITNDSARFFDFDVNGGKTDQAYRNIWRKEPGHEYNYILKVPMESMAKKWEIMRSDLSQYFPFLSARIEHQNREIFVLQRIGDSSLFRSKDTGTTTLQISSYYLVCNKLPMNRFLIALMTAYQDKNVVDETGYTGDIDLHVECPVRNLSAMNQELSKFGLILKQRSENAEVLIIKDLRSPEKG
jgi:thiol-disulfide isomerase/thioredoxin